MKKLLGIISLVVCVTMLLCGCGNWKNYKSVQVCSIQSDSTITIKMDGISGDNKNKGTDGWTYYCSDEKSKEQMLCELKEKNDFEFFTENGFDFIRVPDVKGVYFLNIFEKEVKLQDKVVNRTSVRIDDMSCTISVFNETDTSNELNRFPFPYFIFTQETGDGMHIDGWWLSQLEYYKAYDCNVSELLSLVKTLGIWEVEEKENSFIMSFKEDKVEVVYGDGTVTLQPVAK